MNFLGGILGPTFSYIISEQFRLLKAGDRFFFTNTQGLKAAGLDEGVQVLQRFHSKISTTLASNRL